ncbi:MAG: major facilitator superfamily domain-containing protein 7, partial [Chloroflexi bacterium]|nr:major facilitator superfamily domain-containing protein 7 [Chloroflexota bacterium]
YRWIVLLAYMFVSLMMQVLWICYAPITKVAAEILGVSDLQIGLLAMLFMYIFIPLALPASWLIDTWGFKRSVSLGAILMAIFGLLRGIFTENYTLTLIMTVGLAAAQPLFLNSGTKLVANWFRLEERATVVGLGGLASLLGVVIGQIATPLMLEAWGLRGAMLVYGILSVVSALLFVVCAREHPPTPAGHEERVLMLDGLKRILSLRDFYVLAFVFFVINAIFNGISTWVEVIVRPKGLEVSDAGLIGGLLMIGGILGFLIFPTASDRLRRRRPVVIAAALLSVPFLVLLPNVGGFATLAVVAFLLGLCVLGGYPVLLQYATEICYPAPEGTSQGVLMLAGQISVVAVTAMGWSNEVYGSFTPSLLVFAGSMVVGVLTVSIMKESRLIQATQHADGTKMGA